MYKEPTLYQSGLQMAANCQKTGVTITIHLTNIMSNYFNDFFNGWTDPRFKKDDTCFYFARENNPVLHDAQETLWRGVYDKVAMLISRTNLGLSIENLDVRRIALQPGRNQNGPRLLRQEPFLYAYSGENDFFVIKFVFSPDNGIQIGIDYRGIRERNNDARMRFHQYLQHPLPNDFILKGSRKDPQEGSRQYTNANQAIEALQTRGNNKEPKIEPCIIISKNGTYDDDRYMQYMEDALIKSSNFRDQLIEQDTNHNINKEQKNAHQNKFSFYRNRIIFGAPGTGKSHTANLDANALLLGARNENSPLTDDDKKTKAGHMERVTFHPEYSYYDFVGSYKPVMKNVKVEGKDATERKIEYDFVPGPFTRILVKALKDKEHPYLLLIEEINRARVAAVFGDIFQLLDRTEEGESEYSICLSEDLKEHFGKQGLQLNELKLPPNLYIWATMNSADQGVYPLDTAFKRRWSMEYLDIDSGKKDNDWDQIRTGINKLLIEKGHVNEDKLMGYYFLKAEEMADAHLEDSLKGKVLMYLFDDAAKPCRKDIFKGINKARIYSDLRAKLSLSEPNLGIFDGAVFWLGKNTTTGSDQDNAAPKAEEAEHVDNQQ